MQEWVHLQTSPKKITQEQSSRCHTHYKLTFKTESSREHRANTIVVSITRWDRGGVKKKEMLGGSSGASPGNLRSSDSP
jgi:hypothetical protein